MSYLRYFPPGIDAPYNDSFTKFSSCALHKENINAYRGPMSNKAFDCVYTYTVNRRTLKLVPKAFRVFALGTLNCFRV